MRKRNLFIGSIIFCAVVLVGAFLYASPQRVKEWAHARLVEAFNRPVALESASLNWFGPAVVVSGLQVSERTGFGDLPFLTASRARLAVPLLPLITGRARLGELVLEEPALSLVVNRKGEINTADLFARRGKGNLSLPVDRMRVENGRIGYDNWQTGRGGLWQGVTGQVQGALVEGNVAVKGSLSVDQLAILPLPGDTVRTGAFDLGLDAIWKRNVLSLNAFKLGLGPVGLTLTGQVRGLPNVPVVDLRARDQAIDFERVQRFLIRSGVLSDQARITGSGHLSLAASGAWPFAIEGELVAQEVHMSDPDRLQVPVREGAIHLVLKEDRLRVHTVQARAGGSNISGSGVLSLAWLGRSHLSFVLVSQLLDVTALDKRPPATARWGFAVPAQADVSLEQASVLGVLNRVDLDGSVQVDTLRWGGTEVYNLRANVQGQKDRLQFDPVTGQVHDGALEGRGVLAAVPGGATVEASGHLVNAQAGKVLQHTLGWRVPLQGRMRASVQVEGMLDTALAWQAPRAKATGVVKMPEGRLVNWTWLQQALKGVEQLGVLRSDEVPIDDATVVFAVQGHTVQLDGTKLRAADMACRLSGVGQVGGKLNYALDVDVPSSRVTIGGLNLGQALGGLFGQSPTIPVRINIAGSTTQPQVTMGIR